MNGWPISSDRLRAMYVGGRGNATARWFARFWAVVFSIGLLPRRWVTLEVIGRRSGQVTRFPLGMARLADRWYLVPMLGEHCNWVQNVRAAQGLVTLHHRRAVRCRLQEIPVGQRAPVLQRYLRQVPGARPHFPISRHASMTDFEGIAPSYPVFLVLPDGPRVEPTSSRRRRHWWRWILIGVIVVVCVVTGAVAAYIKLGPSAAPLALPPGPVRASTGPLAGAWQVSGRSLAGFRVQETALGLSNYVGGQTPAVSGVIVISGTTVDAARLQVNLTTVTISGKVQAQFATSLGTRDHPVATFTLTRPVTLGPAFAAGQTITATVSGELTMNGAAEPVTVTLAARRDGSELQTAGSIPVQFARWSIKRPAGFGFVGSLADHGSAEFLLILVRQR